MDTTKLTIFALVLAVTALFSTVGAERAAPYNATMVGNPMVNFEACGNKRTAFVCDPEDILNQTRVRQINATIQNMLGINHCPCDVCEEGLGGYVFGVVIVPRVQVGEKSIYRAMKDFAMAVRESWQLGSCGNDAILVVSTEQGKVYTATGDRLELHLSDVCIEKANDKGRRFFPDHKHGVGILKILEEYGRLSKLGCYTVRSSDYINEVWLYGVLAGLSVALILLIIWTVTRCRTGEGPKKERIP